MCVIAVKPKGIQLPTEEKLKSMWDANSDGAGYMFNMDGKVHIKKGFMKFEDFKASIDNTYRMLTNKAINAQDVAFIYHFRIATHGTVLPQNTHPYPISDNIVDLGALEIETDMGMAHNGVISKIETSKEENITDTATFVRDVVTPFHRYTQGAFLKNQNTIKTLESVIGASKLSFMTGDGEITKIGRWNEGTDGICYSNLNHEYTGYYTYPYYGGYSHVNTQYVTKPKKLHNVKLFEVDLNKFQVDAKIYTFSGKESINHLQYLNKYNWYVSGDMKYLLRKNSQEKALYLSDAFVIYEDFDITDKKTMKQITKAIQISTTYYPFDTLEYTYMVEKDTSTGTKVINHKETEKDNVSLKRLKEIPRDSYYIVRWGGQNVDEDYKFYEVEHRKEYYISPDNTIYKRIYKDIFRRMGNLGDDWSLVQTFEAEGSKDGFASYETLGNYDKDSKKFYLKNKTVSFKKATILDSTP